MTSHFTESHADGRRIIVANRPKKAKLNNGYLRVGKSGN